jgi:ATP-dependent DNA helicase RecQ
LSIHEILYQHWGHQQFRPLQEEICQSVLEGKDTLALLPTGGGKSICFQVPALAQDGLCLVISPLIALMKDQVENLRKKDIPALLIYSGMTYKQVNNILKLAVQGNYKFLYVSPERLETKLFLEYLPALDVNLIAVDEAHCISQWGYDFRPPYLRIATIREQLRNVPVLALTASATKDVQQDICEKLLFKNKIVFQKSFTRPNLSYSVFEVDSKINKTVEILNNVKGSAIVYCKSRRRTKEVSDMLRLYNINAGYYNAGLSNEERSEKQQLWIDNKIRVIVCTNAFGMGIDKPDVRVVIHYDPPDCLENYYQEAGRAGRDEKKAFAVLLYQEKDIELLQLSADVKYPKPEDIKQVYLAISNYLQLTYGSGEGQYFDFDINEFCKNFKLDIHLVMNSIKVLEQEELISYSESVFTSSTIQFTCSKSELYNFEKTNPTLENVIKTLLRAYAGIFDYPVYISTKNITYLSKENVDMVEKKLQNLHQYHIIEYLKPASTPQLYFIKERLHADNFMIHEAIYQKRKAIYLNRVNHFINYVHSIKECRSVMISTYFGVKENDDCNCCDHCLERRKQEIKEREFMVVETMILTKLNEVEKISLKEFKHWQMQHPNQILMSKVIAYLFAEELLAIHGDYIKGEKGNK